MVSFVGALTYWPLTLGAPVPCYIKVWAPSRRVTLLLWAVWWGMLVVSVAAAVGAFRAMVVGWGDVQYFQ
jgi:hypothetical protein